MKKALRWFVGVLLVEALAGVVFVWWLSQKGIGAREEPPAPEVYVARLFRHLAVPARERAAANPVALKPEVLSGARAHFADHCASCHGNDGRGQTTIGKNLYPKAPDMTLPATQNMSDGEIFYTIKHGVRLTGMPAWGEDTKKDDEASWALVHFIRHLPKITPEEIAEMEALNPKSPDELRRQKEEQEFLEGGGSAPASPSEGHTH
jgi:mono/diheme cytochrome c family protein